MFLSHAFCRRVNLQRGRDKAVELMAAGGYSAIGGDPTPIDRDQALAIVSRIDDATLDANAPKTQIGDGSILLSVEHFFEWLASHSDQILAVAKLILQLASLFKPASAPAAPTLPPASLTGKASG